MGLHQKGVALVDLPQTRQAHEKNSHHYHVSALEYHHKGLGDLIEVFQRITSEEKLLSSCAVFPTVTSSTSTTITITTTISPSGPYL